ncbi:uncharacterized protein BJ212DRAFT_1294788 [Suillus subaureus]|uniref:Agglutinin C-terminal domain-containing protein n=1 Tax=Suillus subaureus TaxID=48587 RepID=A0A9P7EQM3_9AGAM|nr:uncharacterized protein BJ212DRAFT_1294788 [Suillus subaureus]KAG1827551.1 hypothetical protein BJ212DRAFT_1294788 [Suillus subaureus]
MSSTIDPGVYSIISKDFPSVQVLSWDNLNYSKKVTLGALTPWDKTTMLSTSAVAFLQLWLVELILSPPFLQSPTNTFTMWNLSSREYLASDDGKRVNTILRNNLNECWDFQKVSISNKGVSAVLGASNIVINNQSLSSQVQLLDSKYLVLSKGMLQEIWNGMMKHNYHWEIYDEDGLAIAFKLAVAKWGVQSILKDVSNSKNTGMI